MIEQVRLGSSGLSVSRVALGMMSFGDTSRREWVLDETAAEAIVKRALEAGITFFDTADMYAGGASEIVTGRLLRKLVSREEVVVASKVFYQTTPGPNGRGLSRKHVLAAIDATLQRLQLDHVDLYQIHRWDPDTPIEETVAALHDVVRAGKARYLGASTMAAWQFAKAQATAERHRAPPFVSMQNHYNLLYREEEREMIPLCLDQGVGILPYSPLARGLLAASSDTAPTPRAKSDPLRADLYGRPGDRQVLECVRELAQSHGVAPAEIALSWLMRQPGVTAPILGTTSVTHVDSALAASELVLEEEELARLRDLYTPHHPDIDTISPGGESK